MKKLLLMKTVLLLFALVVGSGSVWATPTTYNFSSIPTTGWSTSGSTVTINSKTWTYSSATYIGNNNSRIQVGSSSKPQTTAWTIQTPVSSFFSSGKTISSISITAYTTATSATYSISAGGSTVRSGSLTTSSATYTADGLNITSGNIVVTLTGSSTSKAMYLSNISVTYDDVSTDPAINASSNVNVAYDVTSGEFNYTISNPVDATELTASVTAGGTWLSNASVDAVNGKVTFTTTENEDEENAREGTIHLVYGSNLATKDVTITQAKAPVKYTVTIDEPTGGTLVVKDGETVVASGTKVANGTELTIIPTANENYKYVNWQYKAGSGSWTTRTTTYTYTVSGKDVEFKATFAPTYPVNWSVNGEVVATTRFAENDYITFPDDPADIAGFTFVGWVNAAIAGTTDDKPEFLTNPKMGTSVLTYYAVFAKSSDTGTSIEKKEQTLEYDTWTYSGTTTDKNSYRMFGNNSYVESAAFDLSKLSKVIVYGGTFGGSSYKNLTIGDGTNVWKNVVVSGDSQTGVNTYTDGTALSGTKSLRVISNSGDGSNNGIRISKVEIFTSCKYISFCTTAAVSVTPAKTYTTLTSAKALDFTSVSDDLKAYIATTISDKKVQMVQVNKVPAGTGLVLKATTPGAAVNVPVFDGTGADDVSANKMAGSATATTEIAENGGYILKDGVFQPATAGTLAAGKAYLAIAVSGARALEMSFEDDVTAIEAVKAQNVENVQYFNLAGQRVAQPTKGLYIVNGKKVKVSRRFF